MGVLEVRDLPQDTQGELFFYFGHLPTRARWSLGSRARTWARHRQAVADKKAQTVAEFLRWARAAAGMSDLVEATVDEMHACASGPYALGAATALGLGAVKTGPQRWSTRVLAVWCARRCAEQMAACGCSPQESAEGVAAVLERRRLSKGSRGLIASKRGNQVSPHMRTYADTEVMG